MSPSAERKRAGFVIGERLWVGTYGETFRAAGAGRRDLHALIVDARIGREPGVASALLDDAVPALRALHHRAIVGTVAAVRDAGDLVVVTEEAPHSITLHEVLTTCRSRGLKVPQEISAAVGRAIVDAAATAHAAGVVHGAIHPRSVLIDGDGQVRLGDFAIGRAVVSAVTRGANADLLRGLAGYVAPELAGDLEEPTAACDVHALGAILFTMLSGELPPGSLHTTPAMERLVQRALDPELARRFQNAIELQENLAEALEDDRWFTASAGELARFVARARTDDSLDSQTEDLLASLGVGGDPPIRDPLEISGLDGALDADEHSGMADRSGPTRTGSQPRAGAETGGGLDSVLADLDLEDNEPLTEVDGARSALRGDTTHRDPISEMLEIERARTGAPVVIEPEPPRKKSGERARRLGAPPPAIEPAEPAVPPRAAPRIATPFDPGTGPSLGLDGMPSLKQRRGMGQLVWLIVVALAGAGLVYVILHNQNESRDQAARDKAQKDKDEETKKKLEAELPDPGSIVITSDPDEAAVWLLLGRTPVDSIGLPTSQLHQLRIELDGYTPIDQPVGAKDWQGEGTTRKASFTFPLVAAKPNAAPPPPMPDLSPEMEAELSRGLAQGRGFIHVDSTPTGAAVWLLVGNSTKMKLGGIEAGRDYDLKVVKDGFTPGYVHIGAEEWRDGGDPNLPLAAAPKHDTLTRPVTLTPAPTAPIKKPK